METIFQLRDELRGMSEENRGLRAELTRLEDEKARETKLINDILGYNGNQNDLICVRMKEKLAKSAFGKKLKRKIRDLREELVAKDIIIQELSDENHYASMFNQANREKEEWAYENQHLQMLLDDQNIHIRMLERELRSMKPSMLEEYSSLTNTKSEEEEESQVLHVHRVWHEDSEELPGVTPLPSSSNGQHRNQSHQPSNSKDNKDDDGYESKGGSEVLTSSLAQLTSLTTSLTKLSEQLEPTPKKSPSRGRQVTRRKREDADEMEMKMEEDQNHSKDHSKGEWRELKGEIDSLKDVVRQLSLQISEHLGK
jgi:hypothetical protein